MLRFGKTENVSVKLGTFPGKPELAKAEPPKSASTELSQLGLSLSGGGGRNAPKEGVMISDVDGSSDAATKGLKAGDVILDVQGQKVSTPAEVEAGVQSVKTAGRPAVLLRVKSGEAIRFVAVQFKKG